MGKRFVTRSRQEWEAFIQLDSTDAKQVEEGASAWLATRLEGYVQSIPDAPITLAVPDRYAKILGDAPEETMAESLPGKG